MAKTGSTPIFCTPAILGCMSSVDKGRCSDHGCKHAQVLRQMNHVQCPSTISAVSEKRVSNIFTSMLPSCAARCFCGGSPPGSPLSSMSRLSSGPSSPTLPGAAPLAHTAPGNGKAFVEMHSCAARASMLVNSNWNHWKANKQPAYAWPAWMLQNAMHHKHCKACKGAAPDPLPRAIRPSKAACKRAVAGSGPALLLRLAPLLACDARGPAHKRGLQKRHACEGRCMPHVS